MLCSIEQLLKITRLETSPRVEEPCSSSAKDAPRDFEFSTSKFFPFSPSFPSLHHLSRTYSPLESAAGPTLDTLRTSYITLFLLLSPLYPFFRSKSKQHRKSAPTLRPSSLQASKNTLRVLLSLSPSHSTSTHTLPSLLPLPSIQDAFAFIPPPRNYRFHPRLGSSRQTTFSTSSIRKSSCCRT